ncbi:TPA: HNH endonuclease [Vibrio diabolicus]|uniref:HNH endonuclease n=1 Tax=Vibrio sp. HS-50-1 TaxID=2945079 RepID=UPI0021608FDA|nr:hypothetical protein [Vibrio sp. HS-50-1]MCS0206345.1 hypothetical protein [Vibrio sp. HS-50-1]
MKKLPLPSYQFLDTFNVCLQDCDSENLPAMIGLRQHIPEFDLIYQQRASNTTLHQLTQSRHGHSEDIVVESITKADFVDLYEKCFVKTGTSGRTIYDALRASSDGLCPLCGIGSVSTLDHYLPKARYPLYSVNPCNLVPACMDCNKGKGSSVLNSNVEEPLHPYFVSEHFIDEHWISAEIVETTPVTARFFPSPLATWSQECQQRAINHFNDFDLASRYKTQASLLFTMLTERVRELKHEQGLSTEEIQANFLARTQTQPPNSIARALMEAIAQSEWFCSEQYLVF